MDFGNPIANAIMIVGIAGVLVILLFVLWLAFELFVVGLANSISFHRWMIADKRSPYTWQQILVRLPWSVLTHMFEFWGRRNTGSETWTRPGSSSQWRGIGDWTVGRETAKGNGGGRAAQRREVGNG